MGTSFTTADTHIAIQQASDAHGVSHYLLDCIVFRESTYNPYAVNSRSGARGAVQLMSGGELNTFYRLGYDDPYNPYQAVDFLAVRLNQGGGPAWSVYYGCL